MAWSQLGGKGKRGGEEAVLQLLNCNLFLGSYANDQGVVAR
jgi:hypothetical protein